MRENGFLSDVCVGTGWYAQLSKHREPAERTQSLIDSHPVCKLLLTHYDYSVLH